MPLLAIFPSRRIGPFDECFVHLMACLKNKDNQNQRQSKEARENSQ